MDCDRSQNKFGDPRAPLSWGNLLVAHRVCGDEIFRDILAAIATDWRGRPDITDVVVFERRVTVAHRLQCRYNPQAAHFSIKFSIDDFGQRGTLPKR